MKKLLYVAVAMIVVALTSCGGSKKVAENYTKQIGNVTSNADVYGSFRVVLGDALFTIYESEGDTTDFMVEVPVIADNTKPVNNVSSVTLSMWYDTEDGKHEQLVENMALSDDQLPKALEMAKAAVATDTVKYTFNGRAPKASIEALRTAKRVTTSTNATGE